MPDIIAETKEPLSTNDVLDALKDDTSLEDTSLDVEEKTEEVELKKPEEEKEEEEPEEDEDKELEKAEIEEEDLEYQDVPKRQEILKAFPDLFKKFPGVERAIYREAQFTNVFATPKDAEEAKSRIETFGKIENDLFNGNIGNLLGAVKQQDPKAFGKITNTLLSTLGQIDRDAYFGVIDNIVRHAIKGAADKAKELGGDEGEQLGIAAQLINKFFYNTTNITAPAAVQQKEDQENPEQKKLSDERKAFDQQRLDTAVNDVKTKANKAIESFVQKYIDPKNLMSDYVKTRAIKDVLDNLDKEIGEDSRFRQHLDKLWVSAYQSGFNENSKDQIRKAILKRVQSSLPGHIRNVRAIASKGNNSSQNRSSVRKQNDSEPETKRTAPSRTNESNPRPSSARPLGLRDVMKALE